MSGDWSPAFEGQRPPRRAGDPAAFKPGNDLAVKHGAYSKALGESPHVDVRCEELRSVSSWLAPADDAMLRAFVLAEMQFAIAAHVTLPPPADDGTVDVEEWAGRVERRVTLSRDAQGWLRQLIKLGDRLGLTPAGRAALEERERTLVPVADVKVMVNAFLDAFARIVTRDQQAAFLAAIEEAQHAVSPLGILSQPLVIESAVPDESAGESSS